MKYAFAAGLAVLALTLGTVGLFGPRGPASGVVRSVSRYDLPDVTLVNQKGEEVRLLALLAADRPVFLHFIYTTCTTTSPVLSAAFSAFQRTLTPDSRAVHLLSVTIDPETDTPRAMQEHLTRYHALPGWDFLTGRREDVEAVSKAFGAFMPDKALHYPVTLARSGGSGPWVRLQGLVAKTDLARERDRFASRQSP